MPLMFNRNNTEPTAPPPETPQLVPQRTFRVTVEAWGDVPKSSKVVPVMARLWVITTTGALVFTDAVQDPNTGFYQEFVAKVFASGEWTSFEEVMPLAGGGLVVS